MGMAITGIVLTVLVAGSAACLLLLELLGLAPWHVAPAPPEVLDVQPDPAPPGPGLRVVPLLEPAEEPLEWAA